MLFLTGVQLVENIRLKLLSPGAAAASPAAASAHRLTPGAAAARPARRTPPPARAAVQPAPKTLSGAAVPAAAALGDFSAATGAEALRADGTPPEHGDALLLGEEPRVEAMVLLDMVGRAELHIQEELSSTELMRQICWSAAVATKNQDHFYVRAEAAADDHKPFLDVGIPAVDLIDLNGNPTWHTPYDTVDKMSPDSIQKVADVVLTMLPAIEQAYIKSK